MRIEIRRLPHGHHAYRGRAGVRERAALRKAYGPGRWRKLRGIATIRLPNGTLRRVELHWYEAQGVGRRDMNIKRYLDQP